MTPDTITVTIPDTYTESYMEYDVSHEAYRVITTMAGTYRIDNPVTVQVMDDGLTLRVIDAQGCAHTYANPATGRSIECCHPRG